MTSIPPLCIIPERDVTRNATRISRPPELLVQFLPAEYERRRPPVRAVGPVLGRRPQPRQVVDLLRARPVPGLDCRLTGHRRQQPLEELVARRRSVLGCQDVDDALEDLANWHTPQHGRVARYR